MKQSPLVNLYLDQIAVWDKKHRLIGAVPVAQLYHESLTALRNSPNVATRHGLVDIGAGSGILGICALLEGYASKIVLIEPAPKKASFLRFFKTELLRAGEAAALIAKSMLIIDKKLEDVSRETLDQWFEQSDYLLVSRAFSGASSLASALAKSQLADLKAYVFYSEANFASPKYMLKELKA